MMVSCGTCGASLHRYPSGLSGRRFGSFCDVVCLGKFRSRELTGEYAANYKIGSRINRGYIQVMAKWHPSANKKGCVPLYRIIAEAALGRFLLPEEIVHHKDGDNTNNHWGNLEVMSQSEHAKLHDNARDKPSGRFVKEKK